MKSIILIITCFFLSLHTDANAYDSFAANAKLVKIEIKQSPKSVTYHFVQNGNKKQLTYSFLQNDIIKLTFGKGTKQQAVTIKSNGNLVFKSGGQTLNFTKSQRQALFEKLTPDFTELVKNNYLNSHLGLQMIKDKNTPEAKGFVEDLPLVRILKRIVDLANGEGCQEDMSCECPLGRTRQDTTSCPCGSIVRCQEISTIVCYWDSTGLVQECETTETCTAICFVPRSRN